MPAQAGTGERPAIVPPRLRVLSCGPIPPHWGGATRGGVADLHQALLVELARGAAEYGVDLVGLLAFNLDAASSMRPPFQLHSPPEGANEMDFYAEVLDETSAEVVLFMHAGHRWAVFHARLGSPVPAVASIQSWHSVTTRSGEPRRRAAAVLEEALAGLSGVVLPSAHCHREGAELGFAYPRRETVVPDMIHPVFLEEDIVPDGERTGVLFVGELMPRKRPEAVVSSVARIDGLSATVVGSGELESELVALAHDLGVRDRIRFTGSLPLEEVRELMLRAELLCVPSASECLALVYLDAVACGTPLVGFGPNVSEIGDWLGVDCGEGVWEGTADEVAAAIVAVRSRSWDRRELRERATAAFDSSSIAGRYADFLREAATGGGHRG